MNPVSKFFSIQSFLLLLAGYASGPMPSMMAPPGAPSLPGAPPGAPLRPPAVNVPTSIPGSTATPTSSSSAPTLQAMYQANPAAPTSGGYDSFNANTQASESNQ